MNKAAKLHNLVKQTVIVFLLSMAVAGCSPKPSEQEAVGSSGDETLVVEENELSYDSFIVRDRLESENEQEPCAPTRGAQKGAKSAPNVGDYEIRLGVAKTIKKGSQGEMTVRIGLPENLVEKDTTEVSNSRYVAPSEVGVYARVTPRASDFIIEPNEPQLVLVKPNGSTAASFLLTPKQLGEFKVDAKVEFFSTDDFSSIVAPQWTNTLSVNVIVDKAERKINRGEELDKVSWTNFKGFYEALVALVFAALLFVIRKFIKKKTGYSEIPSETPKQEKPSTIEIPTQETPSTPKEIELGEEDYEVIEPEAPSSDSQKVSESDDEDDYDD